MAVQITFNELLQTKSLMESCASILNQLVFKTSKAYVNVDGTYFDFGSKLNHRIFSTDKLLKSGRYKFSPYRQVKLTRTGKERLIYLATWRDKIVEKWIADTMSICLKKYYSHNSYAYKSGKYGLDFCQFNVTKHIKHNQFIVRRDISQYFYSIPQDTLLDLLSMIVPPDDLLYGYLKQRIKDFEYNGGKMSLGIPFGSPIACVLANVYLTPLDRVMERMPIKYFRYADDFLILAHNEAVATKAMNTLDAYIEDMQLSLKPSHKLEYTFGPGTSSFKKVSKFGFLGLEYTSDGQVRMNVSKQRKVLNFFRRIFKSHSGKIKRTPKDARLQYIIDLANETLTQRIRSAAIIDYYLKHVTDESQLKQIDMLLAQMVIVNMTNTKFRFKDFTTYSFKMLRQMGLPSLVHRKRLFKQGHLKVDFLDMHNSLTVKRHETMVTNRQRRINSIKLSRKLKDHPSD